MNENENPYTSGDPNRQQQPPPHHSADNGFHNAQNNTYGYSQPNCNASRPYKPDSYLILAVISTLFGCMPLGIVAICYAAKVDNLYFNGYYDEALRASDNAKKWAIISFVCAVAFTILYILGVFIFCSTLFSSALCH